MAIASSRPDIRQAPSAGLMSRSLTVYAALKQPELSRTNAMKSRCCGVYIFGLRLVMTLGAAPQA
jgi:hypothetical protein